jgi:hypothetical protein
MESNFLEAGDDVVGPVKLPDQHLPEDQPVDPDSSLRRSNARIFPDVPKVLEAGEDVVGPVKLPGLSVDPNFKSSLRRSNAQIFPSVLGKRKVDKAYDGVPLTRSDAKELTGVSAKFVPFEGSKKSGGRRKTKRRRKTRRRGKKNSRKRYYRK